MVKIYTTPTCVFCKKTKEFFKEHTIEYQEIDASTTQGLQELLTKSGQMAVPVIDIDGNIVIGFDKGRLKELLHIK